MNMKLQGLMMKELTKENILNDLIIYSNDERALKSTEFFYLRYSGQNDSEHNFQRRLTKLMRQLQDEEFAKSLLNKPFYFICSCNEGFYIAYTKKGMVKGIKFYRAKGGKYEFLQSMIYAYKVKVMQMKLQKLVTGEQMELFID